MIPYENITIGSFVIASNKGNPSNGVCAQLTGITPGNISYQYQSDSQRDMDYMYSHETLYPIPFDLYACKIEGWKQLGENEWQHPEMDIKISKRDEIYYLITSDKEYPFRYIHQCQVLCKLYDIFIVFRYGTAKWIFETHRDEIKEFYQNHPDLIMEKPLF